ncbi:MAG: hypothetical protein ACXIUQ_05825 [Cecembia sp.]
MRNTFLNLMTLLGLVVFSFSCGEKSSDPEPQKTPEELATEELAGNGSETWIVAGGGSVQRDGRSETNIYQNFEITFTTNRTYQTINSNSLFDASGNWAFAQGRVDIIVLTGSAPAANQEISFTRNGNNLTLQFNVPMPGARVEAVAGNYTFNLRRKQ